MIILGKWLLTNEWIQIIFARIFISVLCMSIYKKFDLIRNATILLNLRISTTKRNFT